MVCYRELSVLALVLVVGAWGARAEDRWVWGKSIRSNAAKATKIPGYVEPRESPGSTPSPPVTTFRPRLNLSAAGRAASSRDIFPNNRVPPHPFYLGVFPPFTFVPLPPSPRDDGTTKSRVPVDTAFDVDSGAALDAGDKYTTLDRLQAERGPPQEQFPPPEHHQLGGLHPDEVFYADDDLLIIRGGGFSSEPLEEPSQPLDDYDDNEPSHTELSPSRLPSPHEEYNGNIPSIVPPPPQQHETPFSLFMEEASHNNYIFVPYVAPQMPFANSHYQTISNNRLGIRSPPYQGYTSPYVTVAGSGTGTAPSRHYRPQAQHSAPNYPQALYSPPSLLHDTDVNFKHPLPPVNPEAEVFSLPQRSPTAISSIHPGNSRTTTTNFHYYPGRHRQQTSPRL